MADPSTVRVVRRHGFLALIIAGSCVVLMGVFILLWFKLPVWAPEWVIEHSPWVDPIMRAVESSAASGEVESGLYETASRCLLARGVSVAPDMIGWLERGSPEAVKMAAVVLGDFRDDRFCLPLVASMRRHASRVQVEMLARLTPAAVADALLPLPAAADANTIWMLELAARIDDQRLVPALTAIVWEPDPPVSAAPHQPLDGGSRWVTAAWALACSPQPSALPALLPAFGDRDPVIRRRAQQAVRRLFARKLEPRLAEAVRQGLGDADPQVRRHAAMALANGEIPGTEEALLALSRSADPAERAAALIGLGTSWVSERGVDRLGECLVDADRRWAWQGLRRTRRIPSPEITRQAFSMLAVGERKELCRLISASARRREMATPAAAALIQAIGDPADEVSALAKELLDGIALSEEDGQRLQDALERRRVKRIPPPAVGASSPRSD